MPRVYVKQYLGQRMSDFSIVLRLMIVIGTRL